MSDEKPLTVGETVSTDIGDMTVLQVFRLDQQTTGTVETVTDFSKSSASRPMRPLPSPTRRMPDGSYVSDNVARFTSEPWPEVSARKCTNELRFVGGRLQQAWYIMETGDLEWIDVPSVEA